MTKIGAGIAYYGGRHPRHAESWRALLRSGIPIFEVRGAAYSEIARAEIFREALESDVDAVVYIDHDVVFRPEDVKRIAELAVRTEAVVSASAGRPKPGKRELEFIGEPAQDFSHVHLGKPFWTPSRMNGMAFTAVPRIVLEAMRNAEDRVYTNSSGISSVLSKSARPVFSPWQKHEGTLNATPLDPGSYWDPDQAFLARVRSLGFSVLDHHGVTVTSLSPSSCLLRTVMPDREKQLRNGVDTNYVICIPSFGPLDLEQQGALWELEKAGVGVAELSGCPHVDLARSALVRVAIEEMGADGVFFLDHDIVFIPKDVLSLIAEAEKRNDVVSAFYCMRKTAHAVIGAPSVENEKEIGFFEAGSVIPAIYTGLGFSAIPKDVFRALDQRIPVRLMSAFGDVGPYFALDANNEFYSGEDVSFCARVHGLTVRAIHSEKVPGETPNGLDWEIKPSEKSVTGHRVWLDSRIRIFHKGSYLYGIEDHSFAVPRVSHLTAKLCATREEVRAALRTVDELPPEVQARSIGVDEGADLPHPVLP